MIRQHLISIFDRDIKKLIKEMRLFKNESDLWETRGKISNSPGNLACHIVGNLNHFIGHALGKTDYKRDRPLEFSIKNVPVDQIVKGLEAANAMVKDVLSNLDDETLNGIFPLKVFSDKDLPTMLFLVHLTTHLSYHLGQVNYYRRGIVEEKPA